MSILRQVHASCNYLGRVLTLSLTLFKSHWRIYDDHVWLGIIVGTIRLIEGTLIHVEEVWVILKLPT